MNNYNTKPLLTVLMSVYNGGKYLSQAIESILKQTYENFEFLIINDGSNDDTEKIILSYCDTRIKYVKNDRNLGLTKSLNIGIRLAKGRYLARMDADDISLHSRLEKQVVFLNSHPEVAVCGCWVKTISDRPLVFKAPVRNDEIKCHLLFGNTLAHPSVMIRSKVLFDNNLLYDEQIEKAQDYDLWIKISQVSSISNVPEVLVLYRVHGGQISSKNIEKQNYCADIIRYNLLRGIGIALSECEIMKYFDISRRGGCVSIDELRLVKNVYVEMLDLNNKFNYYDHNVLLGVIAHKWWSICNKSSRQGYPVWNFYRSFSHSSRPIIKKSLLFKFFCRCLLRC